MADSKRGSLTDILFGGAAAIVVIVLMQQAQDFAPRARLFPLAVLWVLLCTALITAAAGAWRLWRAGLGSVELDKSLMRLLGASALIASGGFLLTLVGFYLTSAVMILAVFVLHNTLAENRAPKAKAVLIGAVYAVLATGVMYLIFSVAIGLPAPSGTLF